MDIGIIRDPSHTFGITGNGNTSIVIPTERSDEESRKRKAKRDPSHTFGMTNMLDYVISNEREKSLKNIANVSTEKRDPSHTFGMTGNCIKINNKKYHELERILKGLVAEVPR